MIKRVLIASLIFAGFSNCNDSSEALFVPKGQWQKFIYKDIQKLSEKNLTLNKTIAEGEKVENEKLDSLDNAAWMKELEMFMSVNTTKELSAGQFDSSDDQSGKFRITNFYNKDTLALLQQFQIMRFENNVQILSWKLKSRSWMMDRDVEMSYQPQKGYRIQVNENSMWKSPRNFEIFAEIENPEYLRR